LNVCRLTGDEPRDTEKTLFCRPGKGGDPAEKYVVYEDLSAD